MRRNSTRARPTAPDAPMRSRSCGSSASRRRRPSADGIADCLRTAPARPAPAGKGCSDRPDRRRAPLGGSTSTTSRYSPTGPGASRFALPAVGLPRHFHRRSVDERRSPARRWRRDRWRKCAAGGWPAAPEGPARQAAASDPTAGGDRARPPEGPPRGSGDLTMTVELPEVRER